MRLDVSCNQHALKNPQIRKIMAVDTGNLTPLIFDPGRMNPLAGLSFTLPHKHNNYLIIVIKV